MTQPRYHRNDDAASPTATRAISIGENRTVNGRDGVTDASAVRVLIYSHDTFGLGHFRRCLKIARQFAADVPGGSVLILTGSPLVDRYPLPCGVDTVKLPAVMKVGRELYQARSARLPLPDLLTIRSEIIHATTAAFRPHVVLIDHAPVGLLGEARLMLESWSSHDDRPELVLGLRDIVDDPEQVISLWRETGVYDAMDQLYDRILVYGTRDVFDPTDSYAFPPSIRDKTSFVGYICDHCQSGLADARPVVSDRQSTVVVTVGGGEDGQHIVDAYLSMLERHKADIGFHTVMMPGPLLSERVMAGLESRVTDLPVRLEHFMADISPFLAGADLVVAMGGYNTMAEILGHARRALIVPRETPRVEQLMRATRLADRGIVDVLRVTDLTPDNLFASVQRALTSASEPVAEARRKGGISLSGAPRIVELLTPIAATRKGGHE